MKNDPGVTCPQCGRSDGISRLHAQGDTTGCLLLIVGGFLATLVYEIAQRNKRVCQHCGCCFAVRTHAPIGVWNVILIALTGSVLLAAFLYMLYHR
jgi:hypothetical protein